MIAGEGLLQLAREVAGKAVGDEQIEVSVGLGRSTSVRVYDGDVESLRSGVSTAIGIRVVRDGRQGFASAGSLDDDVVADTLAAARANLPFASPDEHQGVAQPDGVAPPGIDVSDDSVLSIDEKTKIETALKVERDCIAADPRVTGVRVATWSDGWGENALASSSGIETLHMSGSCAVHCQPLAPDADGKARIGYAGDSARRLDQLRLAEVVADAVDDTVSQLGARQPDTAKVSVLLTPEVVEEFLDIVGGCLTGERVLKGRSPFADRVGEEIATPLLSLLDDPTDVTRVDATNHDGEGLATRHNTLIDRGVLRGFIHNSYTARRSGTASTGSAIRHPRSMPTVGLLAPAMAAGTTPNAQLYSQADVLIRGVHGLHSGVNPTSGDFSVGVHGNFITNGEAGEPFDEATIASTLQRMLLSISAIGVDPKMLADGTRMYPMVVDDLALSGA